MTKCLPSAKKSNATTSIGRELSAARKPLASSTTTAYGTLDSRKMVLMTPTRPACHKSTVRYGRYGMVRYYRLRICFRCIDTVQ
jgi:hypothetical protein